MATHDEKLAVAPLFPLPNVVLFPRAVLPLHIFEQRYRVMTAHALAGDRQIAMALLRPGWEKSYYACPEIEPIVCIGTILSHERLEDGKYNFLLQGHTRGRVVKEFGGRGGDELPYRIAEIEPLIELPGSEDELAEHRRGIAELLSREPLRGTGLAMQFEHMLSTGVPTADIADLLAFTYFEDAALKQSLLAEADIKHRVGRTVMEFAAICPHLRPVPRRSGRPSMN